MAGAMQWLSSGVAFARLSWLLRMGLEEPLKTQIMGVALTSESVTGFGCRPTQTAPRAQRGRRSKAAREGRRGLWGTRLSGRYGDLAGAVGAASALCSRQRCRR